MRIPEQADPEEGTRCTRLCYELSRTMPFSPEYDALVRELFLGNIGEGSRVMPGMTVVRGKNVVIGKGVTVMNNCLMMGGGGIRIDDDVLVAANVQLISNNHDPHERCVLLCKPVHLKRNCWVGAGSTILPGVTVGENAIVGAASVVTHDVPDNAVAVGNPARVIKTIPKK